MTGKKPIAKFRAGQVASALWENQIDIKGRTVTILKATVQRRYKDHDGNWQSSGSFSRDEIPLAIHCLQKAFEQIVETQSNASNNGSDTNAAEEPVSDSDD